MHSGGYRVILERQVRQFLPSLGKDVPASRSWSDWSPSTSASSVWFDTGFITRSWGRRKAQWELDVKKSYFPLVLIRKL